MILKVLGSSSRGNCYVLENEREALILEAGIRFSEVKRALNFNVSKVAGCLITHEHADHAAHVSEVLKACIPVYTSAGTAKNLTVKGDRLPLLCEAGTLLQLGTFRIIPFEAKHDAAEPLGFFIDHPETGRVLFATDTFYIPNTFAGLNNILIEANYRKDILDKQIESGKVSLAQRNRTIRSHMSYENCLKTLLANDITKVNNIVLIHLSDGNSYASEFQKGIQEATGKTTHIADKGMILNFNKTPF